MPDNLTDRLEPVAAPAAERRRRAEESEEEGGRAGSLRTLIEWLVAIVVAVGAAFAIKTYLVQAYVIPSGSMIPTLIEGDRVLVRKVGFDVNDVSRGDIVVFLNPNRAPTEPEFLIKRAMGLPGDVLEARDGKLYVNGEPQIEPYLRPGSRTIMDRTTVKPGHVFMLGDNRESSLDSRSKEKGQIAEDTLVGEAFFRLWPLSRMTGL
jgi:signal peptidase I